MDKEKDTKDKNREISINIKKSSKYAVEWGITSLSHREMRILSLLKGLYSKLDNPNDKEYNNIINTIVEFEKVLTDLQECKLKYINVSRELKGKNID